MLTEAAMPLTRLVELPGRGTTRLWECPGPRGAETVMLIHGVACTAELNWGKVFAPLARHFRVVAADLRGHGDGIGLRSRFRLEDCADDFAALAGVLGISRFTAVGYSMGGMVAQLLYRRHPELVSGLVLCSTAGNVGGSRAEQLAALTVPAVAAALRWNPMLQLMGAEFFGMALLGPMDDPATGRWVRAQLHRTTLATVVSAMQAVCEFSSNSWIGQIDVPAAVVITDQDWRRAGQPPAGAGPGDPGRAGLPCGGRSRSMHQRAAVVHPRAAGGLRVGSAWPRRRPAHASLTRPARATTGPLTRPGARPPGPEPAAPGAGFR